VSILFPGGKDGPTLIGEAGVPERYGIAPEQVPDFIALRGDPSDGIPGAKGIGEKTAREILRVHGSLEEAIANAAKERPRIAQTLRDQALELRQFKEMATLVHVPLDRPPDLPTSFPGGAVAAEERGMNRLAERLRGLHSGS
jgi:DNA polymerase-1